MQRGIFVVARTEDDIMIILRAKVSVHKFIHMAQMGIYVVGTIASEPAYAINTRLQRWDRAVSYA